VSTTGEPAARGVQSLHRALDLIEAIQARGAAIGISELAASTGLPLPTIHRLLRTLTDRGYVRQQSNRRYCLGFRFVPLAAAAHNAIGADAEPVLADLVAAIGETANLAALTSDRAQYVAQIPSPHPMRMFTEVGRVVDLHATGVGKALLAAMAPAKAARIAHGKLPAQTEFTLTTEDELSADLEQIRRRGYALDEQEQAIGVRCVAVALRGDLSWLAISISGPTTRMTDTVIERAVPLLQRAAKRLTVGIDTDT